MSNPGDEVVGYDRKSRPYMRGGPFIWWLVGAGVGSVAVLVIVMGFSPPPGDPRRQWLGLIMAVLAVAYLALGAWIFARQFARYRAELHRRGQHHAVPTQPPGAGAGR